MENPSLHPLDLAESQQWLQEKEEGKIELIFKEIIAEYPQKWSEFTAGKKGLAGFFMGELMKKSGGKSNPKEAMDILISLQLKK
jgi:aspartyl-tRNA(Asn)/glutamyl-tRNA(Gln) amidotransferase subunit B